MVSNLLSQYIDDAKLTASTHGHAQWVKDEYDLDWNEFYKFAFVRNPWDRLVSWYSMMTQRHVDPDTINKLWQYVQNNSSNFEEFIKNCTGVIEDQDGRKSFMYNQLDYITDPEGDVIIDFVGRFENLDQDIVKVFSDIGVAIDYVPKHGESRHAHYREFYNDETAEIVAERFSKDINYFGYAF